MSFLETERLHRNTDARAAIAEEEDEQAEETVWW
jgi:hypothetical protein